MNANRRFVITGAPGAGKTPVIESLAAGGFTAVPEASRLVAAEQRAIDGTALYELSPQTFVDRILARSIRDFTDHDSAVYDRGLPDVVGFYELFDLDSTAREAATRYRYSDVVFVFPSWPEIYATDEDRTMTVDEAAAFGDRVRRIYAELGYRIVDVPRASIAERAEFVSRVVTEQSLAEIARNAEGGSP